MADEEIKIPSFSIPARTPESLEGEILPPQRGVSDIGSNNFGVSIRNSIQAKIDAGISKSAITGYRKTLSHLEKMGFNLDADLSTLNTSGSINGVIDYILANPDDFEGRTVKPKIGSDIKALINANMPDTPVVNAVEAYEKRARAGGNPARMFDFTEMRVAKEIDLPDFEEFSKAIHKGITKIKDKEVRVFALVKLLTGLRDPDILNIRIVPGKKGQEVGFINPETKTLSSINNKGRQVPYNLGVNVFEILDDLRQDVMNEEGRVKLFSFSSMDTVRKKIQNPIRQVLQEAGQTVTNQKTGEDIPFTLGNLRKNIFDIIDEEEGTQVANAVLGHSTKDVGLNFYKPGRKGRVSRIASSMDDFFEVFSQAAGYKNPQNLLKQYELERASTKVPAIVSKVPEVAKAERTAADATASLLGPAQDAEVLAQRMETAATRAESAAERIKQVSGQPEPTATEDLLGEAQEKPEPTRRRTFNQALEVGGMTQEEVDAALKALDEGDLDTYKEISSEGDRKTNDILKKIIMKGGKIAIAAVAGPLAFAGEVAAEAADATPIGRPIEDTSSEELLESIRTGMAPTGSPDRFTDVPRVSKEIESRIAAESASRSEDAARNAALERLRSMSTIGKSPEQVLPKNVEGQLGFVQQQREEMVNRPSMLKETYEGLQKEDLMKSFLN